MRHRKIFWYAALLLFPALMVIGALGYFCFVEAPRIIRNEPRRVTMLYRDVAEKFKANPGNAVPLRKHPPGTANGKIDGQPWGYFVEAGNAYVWYQTFSETGKRQWHVAPSQMFEPRPYALFLYGGSGIIAVAFLAMSLFAALTFVRFEKERDDFLAATAHDLTTPLVGLRFTLGHSEEESRQLVERLIRLVDNIRDFLKLGGKRKLEITTFDILKTYREAYAPFAADYRDAFEGADVPVDCSSSPLFVRGDESKCLQILWNLLGNDLKYAAPYGPVRVRMECSKGMVSVSFVDEGHGMTRRERRKAFDRYYRAQNVMKSGKGGFGIGLCTSREFARLMGGDLTVGQNLPKGTIFTLSLPAAI